jgi:hypothetical protein
MIVFYVMLVAILIARAAGLAGVEVLDNWHAATRAGLAVMFVFTGIAHFTKTRADLVRMVPPQFPAPELLVTLTGMAEILGAIGLLIPGLARLAAWSLAAYWWRCFRQISMPLAVNTLLEVDRIHR